MIETKQAGRPSTYILSVPGIDAIYVAPRPLATYGLPPAMDNPDESFVTGARDREVAACQRHGVIPGIHSSAALAAKRHAGAFRLITVASDAQGGDIHRRAPTPKRPAPRSSLPDRRPPLRSSTQRGGRGVSWPALNTARRHDAQVRAPSARYAYAVRSSGSASRL